MKKSINLKQKHQNYMYMAVSKFGSHFEFQVITVFFSNNNMFTIIFAHSNTLISNKYFFELNWLKKT